MTYNGSTLTRYRNGIEAARTNISETVSPRTQTLQIGGSKYGEYFNGIIDEVRIYNRPLTLAEIQAYQQDGGTIPAFDFMVSNDGNKSVTAGSSVAKISVGLVFGNASAVNFSVSGLPSGATASFSQNSCNPDCSTILNITNSNRSGSWQLFNHHNSNGRRDG